MTTISTRKEKVEVEIPDEIEKTVRKYAQYAAHVTVPLAWLDRKVRVKLIDEE